MEIFVLVYLVAAETFCDILYLVLKTNQETALSIYRIANRHLYSHYENTGICMLTCMQTKAFVPQINKYPFYAWL